MSSFWRQLKPGSPVTSPRLAQMSVKEQRLNSGLGRFELLVTDVMIKFEPHPLSLKHITPRNMIKSMSPHLVMDSTEAVPQLMSQGQHTLSEWPLLSHVQQSYEANIHLRKAETLWLRQTCCPIRKVAAMSF